jgi:hypothetical protein
MFYIKRATVQDVTRTFVLNKAAVVDFFRLNLLKRDDEAWISLRYAHGQAPQKVRIVQKQDPRIFIDRFNLAEGDLVVFEKNADSEYLMSYVKKGNPRYTILEPLLNHKGYSISERLT